MKTETIAIRYWEDLVFENRNKEYGAYSLRRAYADRLLSGLGATICFVTVILMMPRLFPPEMRMHEPVIMTHCDFQILPPPIIEPVRPPRPPAAPPPAPAQPARIQVVRHVVPDADLPELPTETAPVQGIASTDVGAGLDIIATPLAGDMTLPEREVMDVAEVMPQYDGGTDAMMRFIQKKIRYPHAPRKMGIDGTVFVRFVVNGDGKVTDVEVIRGVHPDYDEEAVRVISMLPSWKGGSHNGRPVAVRMVIPIRFEVE